MDVNELRTRIVDLSHQNAGDAEILQKALGWLNAAYHELMDEVVAYAPAALMREELVTTDAAGRALLAAEPYRIFKVIDSGRGVTLESTTRGAVLEIDPTGSASGVPARVVSDGTALDVHPVMSGVALRVLYIPAVEELVESGVEASILLPAAHHYALVWGGLVWSAVYERGFNSQGDLAVYQRQWELAKQRAKMSLLGGSAEVWRVRPFDLV